MTALLAFMGSLNLAVAAYNAVADGEPWRVALGVFFGVLCGLAALISE